MSLDEIPRCRLALLPTPLQRGPELPGGARLWVKRDDLTGPGMGGNKVRKLEFLAGQALADGADVLVTVGAGQSNHTRQTAAVGAMLGLDVELVLGGVAPPRAAGNQLLSELFGARTTYIGSDDFEAGARVLGEVWARLEAEGRKPAAFPLGGSTAVGALGFVAAYDELRAQCEELGLQPRAIVHATSSGGTHAGLLAGATKGSDPNVAPEVVAVGVGKLLGDLGETAKELANEALGLIGCDARVDDAPVDWDFEGEAYAVPTPEADAAIVWAARHAGLVLDRVYTAKAFAGLLHHAGAGRWGPGDDVVFWHTGGQPAMFAPEPYGWPAER